MSGFPIEMHQPTNLLQILLRELILCSLPGLKILIKCFSLQSAGFFPDKPGFKI